jgi:ADP-ribose pyrophosphatase YjhB (NUDIX family)
MRKERRISAGGFVFREDSVLLVRYREAEGRTYLVAPGGAVEDSENVIQAVIRETKEETDVVVQPIRPVILEDLETQKIKMLKVWML